jgi:uncharacterized protein YbjT (DUF2867 family)
LARQIFPFADAAFYIRWLALGREQSGRTMILVVGATGQVGSLVVRQLAAKNQQVRALVRPTSDASDLARPGVELVTGDLRDPPSLEAALSGVATVVATANVVAPSQRGDTHEAVEVRGYTELIKRAESTGVRRFVYASAAVSPLDDQVPQLKAKRVIEKWLGDSTMSCLSIRFPLFTEVWLALVGSSVPLRDEPRATLRRPYPFLRAFRRVSGRTIEDRGLLVLPGSKANRNAFISVHDAARILVGAVDATDITGDIDVGGPEVLSWEDVARIYADVLKRPVRVVSVPAAAFTGLQRALAPVAPAASNIMGLNRAIARLSTDWETSDVARSLGVHDMQTVEQVLRVKAALPETAASS